jgi:hypothetical protein
VNLVGSFTSRGKKSAQRTRDRYGIKSVEKVSGDLWRFNGEMHCSGVDTWRLLSRVGARGGA